MLAAMLASGFAFGAIGPARAAGIEIEARALFGGHVRPGAWAAVEVTVSNDGPDVSGELRIRTQQQGRSIFGVEAELPSGARKTFTLYAQPQVFARTLTVELVTGEQSLATQSVAVRSQDVYTPVIGLVAERPEGVQRDITDALRNPNMGNAAVVIALRPEDLPTRVEAWAAIDRLVWQDIDAARLTGAQLAALDLWISAGGQLVVLGGSTGPGSVRAMPEQLLPFIPDRTVDVPTADLASLLGDLPADATPLPAIAGTLREGAVLGRAGDSVYAARLGRGQGSVTVIGIDPATPWLARTTAAASLWRRALPINQGQVMSPFFMPDESQLLYALQNLPAVDLPPIESLFVLLVAYIALIGPINYLVLRRLDRREWAWVTMPLLVGVFAVGSYGLGATLKGSDIIVNQVAIVRAGQDSVRGIGQVYVGLFSPTRRAFDVRVGGGALLTSPGSGGEFGTQTQPVDALIGDATSRLRNFEVGFGVVRGFRADAPTDAPRLHGQLRIVGGRLVGSVTNASEQPLEHVAVVFAGTATTLNALAAGETKQIDVRLASSAFYYSLSERIFSTNYSRDPLEQRKMNTRRAVIDQLTGYGQSLMGSSNDSAILLGWQSTPALDVDVAGERPNRVGESLFLVPLGVTYDRDAVFDDALLVRTVIDAGAEQGWGERNYYYLDRGLMVLELRPPGLSGAFAIGSLELGMSEGGPMNLRGSGTAISPLPDDEQPEQDDPVGAPSDGPGPIKPGDDPFGRPPRFGGIWEPIPDIQLFDHQAGQWFELPKFDNGRAYQIEQPQRWVDDTGRLLIRLVNRGNPGEPKSFTLSARLEGTIE